MLVKQLTKCTKSPQTNVFIHADCRHLRHEWPRHRLKTLSTTITLKPTDINSKVMKLTHCLFDFALWKRRRQRPSCPREWKRVLRCKPSMNLWKWTRPTSTRATYSPRVVVVTAPTRNSLISANTGSSKPLERATLPRWVYNFVFELGTRWRICSGFDGEWQNHDGCREEEILK